MKDDKRRIPYNIWLNVLGFFIFLLIASVGVFFCTIGYYADQRVASGIYQYCDGWNGCREVPGGYTDAVTYSNWQDNIARGIMWIIGFAIIIAGMFAWYAYVTARVWNEGEKNHNTR